MKTVTIVLCAVVLAASVCAGVQAASVMYGEILDFQKGYVVLTTGESYPVAADAQISDAKSGQSTTLKPAPGVFAQLTFGPDGTVTGIALSRTPLPAQAGSPQPSSSGSAPRGGAGPPPGQIEFATVSFTVLVPSATLPTDQIFLTTSEMSWSPNAVHMNRIDARHFNVIIQVPVKATFLYLYTRGSPQSIERGGNGLQRRARSLMLETNAPQHEQDVIDHWGDEAGTDLLPPPQTFPTPYNPAPFPNLPPSPHP
jgi:hypothetical protein